MAAMAELYTLCYICGKPAKHVCRLCGRHVCDDHFIVKLGICTACARGKQFRHKIPKLMFK
jgi:hypothetical protein